MDNITITVDDMTVEISVTRTEDGPVLELHPGNCDLEGIAPGEYVLHPSVHAAAS
jgi:hypothetical protein